MQLGNGFYDYGISFLAGVLTSFTPCVFPLIPITLGVIGAKGASGRSKGFILSLAYILGVAVTYSVLGLVAALTGKLMGYILKPWLVNLILANVCIISGLWVLGFVNIPTPGFLKQSPGKDRNSLWGVFVIGIFSGLMISPCVTPVLAGILSIAAGRQNILFAASLLFCYALGLGFILVLVGTFASLIAYLPKSGKWLNIIKAVYAAILIATGEFFLISCGKYLI